ncbi:MAG TPA: hypothetical protein VN778_01220, partial [Verrucomicrobiae bacterium]|nr:hypothetical protein [Verrucomicrobiae bacterium]
MASIPILSNNNGERVAANVDAQQAGTVAPSARTPSLRAGLGEMARTFFHSGPSQYQFHEGAGRWYNTHEPADFDA